MAATEGDSPGSQVNYRSRPVAAGVGPRDLGNRTIHARPVYRFSRLWPKICRVTQLTRSHSVPMQATPGGTVFQVRGGYMYIKADETRKPLFNFTRSARSKSAELPVFAFLRRRYGNIPLNQIESMFGFVERSTLYGGRPFTGSELSESDVTDLNKAGIGLRLPLTNHEVSREEYEGARPFLTRYHHKLNSVIATNDDLATWIAEDFPLYKRDASVIKNTIGGSSGRPGPSGQANYVRAAGVNPWGRNWRNPRFNPPPVNSLEQRRNDSEPTLLA